MNFAAAYAGQVICITGAGGYIGSTLVKALAPHAPGLLILLDTSEYGLFEIQRWNSSTHPNVSCEFILGGVNDVRLLNYMFTRFRVQTVFHAAAFKHVGLLEQNPFAAITNNALASYTFVSAASRRHVSKFVLLSTDKAVNPHSVMGVSKRLAELFTLAISGTNVIRLGNVIGSTGSVIPVFLDQIENGRSLSVTHPEASRYFISRNEAVMSILAAGLATDDGTVLLPEFAPPVRIADLAAFLIGGRSMPVCFTGLRPGEKLTEDLTGPDETEIGTIDGPLHVLRTRRFSHVECEEAVQRLSNCITSGNLGGLLDVICALVPEYVPSSLMREHTVLA